MRVVLHRLVPALVRQRLHEGQRRIGQGEGGGAGDRAGHVGHAVMHHAVLYIGRLRMRGGPAAFEAAALVDGDVHQDGARPHAADHLAGDQLGGRRAGDQHRADDQVGVQHLALDGFGGGEQGGGARAELQVEFLQPRQGAVDDHHAGLQPDRHARRVGAGYAAAQHHHAAGRHAGHAAEQHTRAALFLLQAMGADLHRHPAGDLAHRSQQRQAAARVGDGFIGDAGGAGGHQALGLRLVGGQMQVGEQDLLVAQHGDFAGLRFLHLHDHVRGGEDRCGGLHDQRAGIAVGVVGQASAGAGAGLDGDDVAVAREFPCAGGGQADAVFMCLDLLGNTNMHATALLVCPGSIAQFGPSDGVID